MGVAVYVPVCVCVCGCSCPCVYSCLYPCVCGVCTWLFVSLCVYISVWDCVCVPMCVCVCASLCVTWLWEQDGLGHPEESNRLEQMKNNGPCESDTLSKICDETAYLWLPHLSAAGSPESEAAAA